HAPAHEREVLARVNREIGSLADLARSVQFVRPILDELVKSGDASVRTDALAAMEQFKQRTAYLEHMRSLPEARRLQAEFGSLGVTPEIWRAFADAQTWLIGMTPAREGQPIVVAVRLDEIRSRIATDRGQPLQFVIGSESGELLHESLPGLRVILPPASRGPRGPIGLPILFAIALALVGVLLPACLWLLWRDTQREVHMAELRSQFVSSVS